MADPFVAEIRIFPFNFAPRGWAWCDGQLLPISQNTALFSLVGTYYGGDGKSTFALPDLQGSGAMGQGQGQGLSDRVLGEMSGTPTVTLIQAEMPLHTHELDAVGAPADTNVAVGNSYSRVIGATPYLAPAGAPQVPMAPGAVTTAGGGQPHNNMQPYLTVAFNIALQGVFPPRG